MSYWIRCQEKPYESLPVLIDLDTGNRIMINTNQPDKIPRVAFSVVGTTMPPIVLYSGSLANCINLVTQMGQELMMRGHGLFDVGHLLQVAREIELERSDSK